MILLRSPGGGEGVGVGNFEAKYIVNGMEIFKRLSKTCNWRYVYWLRAQDLIYCAQINIHACFRHVALAIPALWRSRSLIFRSTSTLSQTRKFAGGLVDFDQSLRFAFSVCASEYESYSGSINTVWNACVRVIHAPISCSVLRYAKSMEFVLRVKLPFVDFACDARYANSRNAALSEIEYWRFGPSKCERKSTEAAEAMKDLQYYFQSKSRANRFQKWEVFKKQLIWVASLFMSSFYVENINRRAFFPSGRSGVIILYDTKGTCQNLVAFLSLIM